MTGPLAVVGGGAVGLACAYYLRRAGVDVEVFERRHIGSGSSFGNAGWIVPTLSAPLPSPGRISFAMRSLFNPHSPFHLSPLAVPALAGWLIQFARHSNALDHLRGLEHMAAFSEPTMQLFDGLKADGVEFLMASEGLLFVFLSHGAAESEISELKPMSDYGYDIPEEPLSFDAVHKLVPSLSAAVHAGVHIKGERHLNPSTLLSGLTRRLQELAVKIHEGVEVSGFIIEGNRVAALNTFAGPIEVGGVLLAAGAWTGRLARCLGLRLPIQAGKGYSFSLDMESVPSLPIYMGEAMVGCTPINGHVRLAGTMDLSTIDESMNGSRIEAMKKSAGEYLTGASWQTTRDHWVGMRPLTPDGLPILGRLVPFRNAYVATGHSMVGITLAPATGLAMAQLVTGSTVPALDVFGPARFG